MRILAAFSSFAVYSVFIVSLSWYVQCDWSVLRAVFHCIDRYTSTSFLSRPHAPWVRLGTIVSEQIQSPVQSNPNFRPCMCSGRLDARVGKVQNYVNFVVVSIKHLCGFLGKVSAEQRFSCDEISRCR